MTNRGWDERAPGIWRYRGFVVNDAEIIDRIHTLHARGGDGRCSVDAESYPCRTVRLCNGEQPGDALRSALSGVSTEKVDVRVERADGQVDHYLVRRANPVSGEAT